MTRIAGIGAGGRTEQVRAMLARMTPGCSEQSEVLELTQATLGAVWSASAARAANRDDAAVGDIRGNGHFARAKVTEPGLALERDPFGVAPLYHGRNAVGELCFASEVKALLEVSEDVNILLPQWPEDWRRDGAHGAGPDGLAAELRRRLQNAVERAVAGGSPGAWLSGGLDSSAIVALARPLVSELHTFAAGLAGAPDLEYARAAASHLGTVHHEIVVRPDELLTKLPEVIYHLESFDALLVRSSLANYLAGKVAAGFVGQVLSGEGGDELFAGYEYLKAIDPARLGDELVDITRRLQNTALQRVDRCSAAHGVVARVPFLDPEVAFYALGINPEFKIRDGVEKWILRQALADLLPPQVLNRPKAKFWQGAGIGELLAEHAERHVSDADFRREVTLPDGGTLNSKEELMYYRVFREHFGRCAGLAWMGRTKGVPRTPAGNDE